MEIGAINWLGAVVAAVLAFVLGGAWYSPALFGRIWQREVGLSDEQIANASKGATFGVSFVCALAGSVVFALFLGPDPAAAMAVSAGAMAGLFWVAGSFAISYRFEQRSGRLMLINGGYHTVQYTLYGAVLGVWPW
jgi:hypothetical protein